METSYETVLTYRGRCDVKSICHIRIYEQSGRTPVVIAGELADNTGTFVANGVEIIAHVVKETFLRDRPEFQLVEHDPGPHAPAFKTVVFTHKVGRVDPLHAARDSKTSWIIIDDIEDLVGCPVRIWPPHEYTSRAVAAAAASRRGGLAAVAGVDLEVTPTSPQ